MNKQGYMIAKNRTISNFFTASSAYDRPIWTSVQEATIYPTAELANNALTKLLKNGAYSARLVEAASMQFEFPDEDPNPQDGNQTLDSDELEDDDKEEMSTGQLSDDPLEDLNIEDDDIEIGDEFDEPEERDETLPPEEENEMAFMTPTESRMMKGRRPNYPTGVGPKRTKPIGEGEFRMPGKPSADASPSENRNTVMDVKGPEKIKFSQDTRDERDTNFSQDIEPLYQNVQVPSNVMSAIRDTIATYQKAADFNNGRDDAQASMALTIVDALQTIEDCLKLGTHEGLKQAQIKITSYMNPITTHFPVEVIDYLYKSGRQPLGLKNVFYDKWDLKRAERNANQ